VRVVLDTDVVIAAVRSDRGASRRLLNGSLNRRFTLLLSTPLMLEYESVLTRPQHLAASGIDASDAADLLDALAIVGHPVHLDFRWRPILADADDDMVLETAMNGAADLIVSFNVRDFVAAGRFFEIRIVSSGEALQILRV
jgi:putative PIN family toxin of toxin-antitoxin system